MRLFFVLAPFIIASSSYAEKQKRHPANSQETAILAKLVAGSSLGVATQSCSGEKWNYVRDYLSEGLATATGVGSGKSVVFRCPKKDEPGRLGCELVINYSGGGDLTQSRVLRFQVVEKEDGKIDPKSVYCVDVP